MKQLKIQIYQFIIFFLLFYYESTFLAGMKVAILWKVILIVLILIYFLLNFSIIQTKKFIFFGYLYSIKNLLTLSTFDYSFFPSVVEMVKSAFIPLLSHFFIVITNQHKIDIYYFIVTLSKFIILSTIPFLLGFVKPLNKGYDLTLFGLERFGFIGLFQSAHAASIISAFAIIVLLYEIQNTVLSKKKYILIILIFLGLYVEVQTFARTGLAIVTIASLYILIINKHWLNFIKFIPAILLIGIIFYQYYESSTALQMRFSGTNKYLIKSKKNIDIDSGRGHFKDAAINNLIETGILGSIIGMGVDMSLEEMKKAVGFRIYAHDGFIDIFQFNGFLGVGIYLIFIYLIVNFILNNSESKHIRLVKALFIAYLINMLLRGEHFFLADLIFAASLAMIHQQKT